MSFQKQPILQRDFGAGTIAAIYGAAAVTGAGVNAYAQGKTNRKTRNWNEKMYEWQLRDNKKLWEMQNEYNSPQEQMRRLKAAGLNPNLVYGEGATAMARSSPQGADIKPWNPESPKIEGNPIGEAVLKYNDVRQQQQQIDNLKNQNETETKRQALTDAQTMATLKQAGYTDVQIRALIQEIEQKSMLNPISLQAAQQNVRKTEHEIGKIMEDTQYTRDQNRRSETIMNDTLKNTAIGRNKTHKEIQEMTEKIFLLKKEQGIKAVEAKLAEWGLNPHDSQIIRAAALASDPVEYNTRPNKAKTGGSFGNRR